MQSDVTLFPGFPDSHFDLSGSECLHIYKVMAFLFSCLCLHVLSAVQTSIAASYSDNVDVIAGADQHCGVTPRLYLNMGLSPWSSTSE